MDTNPLRAAKARGPYRHHTREFKLAVVEQALRPGASVARIAREHGLNANQVFAWRRLYRAGDLAAPGLVAVDVVDPVVSEPSAWRPNGCGALIVESTRGTLRIEGRPDPSSLRLVLEHLLR